MNREKLFSVVIPAFGGGELWKTVIDSVLSQDYPAIELIFADDSTPGLELHDVSVYIGQKRGSNLVRYEVIRHENNLGTVKNLRSAHALCTGHYLTHIAMDDAYCDSGVLSRFAHALEGKDCDVLGVYARSLVCDESLVPLGYTSFDTVCADAMNRMTAAEQFGKLAHRCCIHMGATAFIRSEFMEHGDFDTDYRLIEDWPFYLSATYCGSRFLYLPFDAIYYRNGGVTNRSFTSPAKRICCADHIRLYERLILPHLAILPWKDRFTVYSKYIQDRQDMEQLLGKLSTLSWKERAVYAAVYFPVHAVVAIRRKKKFFMLWALGVFALACLHKGMAVITYSLAFVLINITRNKMTKLEKYLG